MLKATAVQSHSIELDIKALSQVEAEIQPVAKVVAM